MLNQRLIPFILLVTSALTLITGLAASLGARATTSSAWKGISTFDQDALCNYRSLKCQKEHHDPGRSAQPKFSFARQGTLQQPVGPVVKPPSVLLAARPRGHAPSTLGTVRALVSLPSPRYRPCRGGSGVRRMAG